jgi:NADPH:quinone reductase-like Zn-dependent oxidoreductase
MDFAGAQMYGVKAEGNASLAKTEVLRELATLIADGELEIPVAKVYRLDEIREAFEELERRHTRGKIVIKP